MQPVIGVDEVGRGCLAGAVFAAACVLKSDITIEGLTDSKLLSADRRTELDQIIRMHSQVGIGIASVEEIEQINILQASLLAMKRAVQKIGAVSGLLLIDGNMKVPGLVGFEQICLIKGELRAAPIAAASIVAKVARDRYMEDLSKEYPGYGFEQHKGYATKAHRTAIADKGVTAIHRKTFAGVVEFA